MTNATQKAQALRSEIDILARDLEQAIQFGENKAMLRCRKQEIIAKERQLTELAQ